MIRHLLSAAIVSSSLLYIIAGCSTESAVVAHERTPEFYSRFVNEASLEKVAPRALHQIKILESDEKYRMRLALFDNGRVYYQVDRLGDGQGVWRYRKGALEVIAYRPLFDMELYISGESSKGESTVVRYFDRFGFNSHSIALRDPNALDGKADSNEPLPEFEASTEGL